MRLRVEYFVGANLRFLSNLEMMRLIERALRRARIPYHLSEGFNPHMKIAMGTVLPVGLWGEREYFDLEMDEMPTEEFIALSNGCLPPGIHITRVQPISPNSPALMKLINTAHYAFVFSNPPLNIEEFIKDILANEQLLVPSRGKNKKITKNLRPGIYRMTLEAEGEQQIINVWASTGEPFNVRFDELLDLFEQNSLGQAFLIDFYRRGNYIKKEEAYYSPLEVK